MENKIKEMREIKNVSQAELAEALDVSQSYICKLENNLRRPTLENMFEIAEALDCSIDELVGRE